MTRSIAAALAASIGLSALVACGFGRSDVGVTSSGAPGIATSPPDSGLDACESGATLCVSVTDDQGSDAAMDWIEVYDADGALVVDEAVEDSPWCSGDLDAGEHLVVVQMGDAGSLSDEVELLCGETVDLAFSLD